MIVEMEKHTHCDIFHSAVMAFLQSRLEAVCPFTNTAEAPGHRLSDPAGAQQILSASAGGAANPGGRREKLEASEDMRKQSHQLENRGPTGRAPTAPRAHTVSPGEAGARRWSHVRAENPAQRLARAGARSQSRSSNEADVKSQSRTRGVRSLSRLACEWD